MNIDGVYGIFFSNIRKDKKLKKDRGYIIRVLSDATVYFKVVYMLRRSINLVKKYIIIECMNF